jgi:hypothetical protein
MSPEYKPSVGVGILGALIACIGLAAFFLFDQLQLIAGGGKDFDFTAIMWAWFGSPAIMGLYMLFGGRFMRPFIRFFFLSCVLLSVGLGTYVLTTGNDTKWGPSGRAFYGGPLLFIAVLSLTPIVIGFFVNSSSNEEP